EAGKCHALHARYLGRHQVEDGDAQRPQPGSGKSAFPGQQWDPQADGGGAANTPDAPADALPRGDCRDAFPRLLRLVQALVRAGLVRAAHGIINSVSHWFYRASKSRIDWFTRVD